MGETTGRGVGRPRERVLSRELISETALRLITEHGATGAGMREIARELGVRPSALYNHVAGQEDLLDSVRELISDRIDTSGFGVLPWDEALRQWARSYRDAFAAHPPTIALLAVRPLASGSRTALMYEAVSAGLSEAGWPAEEVLSTIVAIECFLLGAAFDRIAAPDMLDPGDRDDTENFRAAYTARDEAVGAGAADAAFELGLEALLVGLRSRLSGR